MDKFQATALVGRAVSLSDTSVSAFNLSSLRTGLLGALSVSTCKPALVDAGAVRVLTVCLCVFVW